MTNKQDQLVHFKELAIGSRLKRLSDQLMKETAVVYKSLNVDFDPYHMPIFKLVHQQNGLTISEISTILNVTQPAVTQYVNSLIKKGLVISSVGKIDKRKRKITLSHKGQKLYDELQPVWLAVEKVAKNISNVSSNRTLLDHITYMENALKQSSFSERILKTFKDDNN